MEYKRLGTSELLVSEICLGTMTYGQQNTIAEAHEQLDYAIAQGINFIDTAEMYPVPPNAATQGRTEQYIGEWLAQPHIKQQRDKLIIATKIIGTGRNYSWLRDDSIAALSRKNILQAIDDSLKRLQTDYIDLYQIHWPDRNVPMFGQVTFEPQNEREMVAIADQLATFAELIQTGKIRHLGVSNETTWGISEFSHTAKQLGLPKIVSIQNAYNLINRTFEMGLTEACYREQVGLLAYSPLGFGHLSGKYVQGSPSNTRITLFPQFGQRYKKVNVQAATAEYAAIAQKYDLSPTQLALAFVRSRWFVTSTIIGATTMEQLKENIDSAKVQLNTEILAEIDQVHARYFNPAP
ncbi:NADP(H)-dependent aldo-keto reductase [Pseudanabaena yagii]|uniref:NADP(H)-dependent aldo-keto reductase n=1 Tax=Pseudanabaena yagii GIHE-NHR1 TaxID=2722753 RepID=A0ABX1LPT8_9CYAN|nr:NADP(H)-dependent aldo-keto reductase [Pseudanabaena yagii]NMF57343.1 NADP(H)-dependent aldo-keto reductase [Pseudanabaena yagii GIHE-NHR1]